MTAHDDVDALWSRLHPVEQRDILLDLVRRAAQLRGEDPCQTLQSLTQPAAAAQAAGPVAVANPSALAQPTAAPAPVQLQFSPAVGRQVSSLHTQVTSAVSQFQRAAAQRRAAKRQQCIRRLRTPAAILVSLVLWMAAWQAHHRLSRAWAELSAVRTELADAENSRQQLQLEQAPIAAQVADAETLADRGPSVQADLKKKRQQLAALHATLTQVQSEIQRLKPVEMQLAVAQTKANDLGDQLRQRELQANRLASQVADIEKRLTEMVSAGLAHAIREFKQLEGDWRQLAARLQKIPTELRQEDSAGRMLANVEANIQRQRAIMALHRVSAVDPQVTPDNLKPRQAQLRGMRQALVDGRVEFDKARPLVATVVQLSALRKAFGKPKGDMNAFGHPVVTREVSPFDAETGVPLEIVHRATGIVFVWIPAGEFDMGVRDGEAGAKDERPRHRVKISSGFWVSRYEITQGQYEQVMGNNPSYFSPEVEGRDIFRVLGMDTSRFPVENVSWHDCIAFANKLSGLDSPARQPHYRINNATVEIAGGDGYRLLTEAEWEYVARAGTTMIFPWGDSMSSDQANFDGVYPYGGAAMGTNLRRTALVGSYPANPWGLYDTVGNVWEWVWDWYAADEYKRFGSHVAVDPQGPGVGVYRVLRGGCWVDYGWYCRPTNRSRSYPGNRRLPRRGFRLALGWSGERAKKEAALWTSGG